MSFSDDSKFLLRMRVDFVLEGERLLGLIGSELTRLNVSLIC
jgi:hypothetical protein